MKKRLALLLAMLMLTSCISPALAVEVEPEETPTAEQAEETLYDQFGPWGAWTDEQRTAAESWTDEDWELYWDLYEAAIYRDDEQYWEDQRAWEWEHYDGEDYDYGEETRRQKEDLGMPFPDGPNVSLEGEYLDFGGVAPILAEDEYTILVPFRAFLEALGAQVTYEKGAAVAVLPEGGRIEVKPGDTHLALAAEGGSSMAAMEPLEARSGVLYADVEALAQVLGLGHYRDYYYDTVLLTDLAALKGALDADFTHMNAILAAASATADPTETYAGKLDLTAAGTLYGDKEHHTATAKLHTDVLAGLTGAMTDTTVKVDLGDLEALLNELLGGYWYGSEVQDTLEKLDGLHVRTIADAKNGVQYTKGFDLAAYGFAPPKDVWMRSELTGPDYGEALWALMNAEEAPITVGGLILAQNDSHSGYDDDPYGTMRQTASICALLLGDEAVKAEVSGTTTTYTADVDGADLIRGLKRAAAEDGYTYSEEALAEMEAAVTAADLRFTMKIRERGGKLLDMDLGLNTHVTGMAVSVKLSGTPLAVKGGVSIVGDYLGKVELTLTTDLRTTTEAIPTAPPADEKVIDYAEAFEEWWTNYEYEW